jgi:hypothetical protein
MPLLSDAAVKFLNPIVVLTPNGQFLYYAIIAFSERWTVPFLTVAYGKPSHPPVLYQAPTHTKRSRHGELEPEICGPPDTGFRFPLQ